MVLKKVTKSKRLLRAFVYTNLHQVTPGIKKVTLSYSRTEHMAVKSLIKVSTFFELVTGQRAFFIRAKKSLAALKIRRGVPVGLKTTLRGVNVRRFITKLLYEVLPNLKNFKTKTGIQKFKTKGLNAVILTIPSALNFWELQPFYFFFKAYKDIRILVSFSSQVTTAEVLFLSRVYKLPC